jgi:hypothetical protein
MQLDLAAGFHVPCLVSKSGLPLDGHVLGLITTATTARVSEHPSEPHCTRPRVRGNFRLQPTFVPLRPKLCLVRLHTESIDNWCIDLVGLRQRLSYSNEHC